MSSAVQAPALPRPDSGGSPSGRGGASRSWGWAALVCVGLTYACVIQSFSWNQTSHYDLIQALSHGSAVIDPYRDNTGDKALVGAHYYSARAPGLALLAQPWYALLSAVDARGLARDMAAQRGDDEIIWMIGLWGNVAPGVALLFLVRRAAERFEPGYGTLAAVTLGLGTLVCAMSTLLFSHVLGALLAFGAFCVLVRERDGPPRLVLLGAAGLAGGIGLTVEYPTLFAVAVLGIFALCRARPGHVDPWGRARRGLAFTLGVLVGVVPLAVYNQLTFASLTHVAYADIAHNHTGFFGIRAPSAVTAITLLLDSRGLLVLAPVLVMGAVGVGLSLRGPRRAEARVIAAVALLYLVYNSGYFLPFGGGAPGARFLTTAVPFLALGLAPAFRRLPGPTVALAAASIVVYVLATITHPLVGYETETTVWMRLAGQASFQPTLASAFGVGRGWTAVVPVLVFVVAAVALALAGTRGLEVGWRALVGGLLALAGWGLWAALAPAGLGIDHAALAQISAAGDASALHKPFPGHPLTALVELAGGVGLAALLGARLVSWVHQRRARSRPVAALSSA